MTLDLGRFRTIFAESAGPSRGRAANDPERWLSGRKRRIANPVCRETGISGSKSRSLRLVPFPFQVLATLDLGRDILFLSTDIDPGHYFSRYFSPASIRTFRTFCFGATGQVVKSEKAKEGYKPC